MGNLGSNYLISEKEAVRHGTQHESIVPYQAFKTSDGYITICVVNNGNFKELCQIMKLPHLAEDEKFVNNAKRVENRVELISLLQSAFSKCTTSEWLDTLEGCKFAYGPINNLQG